MVRCGDGKSDGHAAHHRCAAEPRGGELRHVCLHACVRVGVRDQACTQCCFQHSAGRQAGRQIHHTHAEHYAFGCRAPRTLALPARLPRPCRPHRTT